MNPSSPYYPPRAGWSSGLLNVLGRLRRMSRADRICFEGGITYWDAFMCVLVPGYAFNLVRRHQLAKRILLGWGAGAITYIVLLGYFVGNLVFGLMVGMHTAGLIHLYNVFNGGAPLKKRVVVALCAGLGLFYCYHLPLRVVNAYFLLPLKTERGVLVINRMASRNGVKRGDVVAYSIGDNGGHGWNLRGGTTLDRVLGLPGDQLKFSVSGVEVNGQTFPGRKWMPVNQTITVPENCWFIWPDLNIQGGHGQVQDYAIAGLMAAAVVPQDAFVGRPFNYWFGRRQKFP
jgi:hypothetical protein